MVWETCVQLLYFELRPEQNAIRGDAPEGSDIPMASNRKRSRGRIKADNMGQGEGPNVPLQSDALEESDL